MVPDHVALIIIPIQLLSMCKSYCCTKDCSEHWALRDGVYESFWLFLFFQTYWTWAIWSFKLVLAFLVFSSEVKHTYDWYTSYRDKDNIHSCIQCHCRIHVFVDAWLGKTCFSTSEEGEWSWDVVRVWSVCFECMSFIFYMSETGVWFGSCCGDRASVRRVSWQYLSLVMN